MKKLLVFLLALAAAATMSLSAMAQEEETAEEAIVEIETEEAAEEAELFAEEEPAAEVTAENAVAKVGNTYYATIDEAIAAWTNGTTLTLLADVTLSSTVKIPSTEKRILDLDEYTLTAPKSNHAIEIVANSRANAGDTLLVYADETNPGGMSTNGGFMKACIYYNSVNSDRPTIKIFNGVFDGTYAICVANSQNDSYVYIYDGVFNATLKLDRAKTFISGGVFHSGLMSSVDSTAYLLISGGRFYSPLNNNRSALNSGKWGFGTAIGTYNVEIYVDDDGYYVVDTPIVTKPADFEASVFYDTDYYVNNATSKGIEDVNGAFVFSNVGVEKQLYYTSAEVTLKKNTKGIVTLYTEADTNVKTSGDFKLDMTDEDANYTGNITFGAKNHTFVVVFDSDKPYSGEVTAYPGCALGITETRGAVVTRTYSNVTPVAKIGDTGYATLGEAIKAAQANDTIELVGNVTEDVTINKNITIDGADKDYTGKMNVTANITIKNVNFDGKGMNTYAVETRSAATVVIEDCTAKNYGYGFLQVVSNNNTTKLKNVTITDVAYGVKVDYSNGVSLENVNITASVAAVLNSNYGRKTITIKDSNLSILGTWTRNNTTKTNIVFEGDNTVDEFVINAAIDEFKLAASATLTAPNTITVIAEDDYVVKYIDGTYKNVLAVAKIGDDKFATLAEAFTAASANADGTVIELLPVTIEEGTVKLPATLTNVTLKGVEGAVIKDTTIMSSDGNSVNYDGFTVKNITFENSNFVFSGQRNGGVLYKDFKFENNKFLNTVKTGNEAAVHFNIAGTEDNALITNFSFIGNTIDNLGGSQNSGIFAASGIDGEIVIKNNTINNVSFIPLNIRVRDNNGTSDSLTITGNTFSGTADGYIQALSYMGGDEIEIAVNYNVFKGITDSYQIYFYDFDEAKTTVDFSRNYYEGVDVVNEPSAFYYNTAFSSVAELDKYEFIPYYLDEALTILFDGRTADITVEFAEVLPKVEGEITYNINLVASDESTINRLNSGDLTFKLTTTDGEIDYKIIDIAGDNITVSPVNNDANRYEFHFDTKANVGNDTAKTITIAQVKFTGYGEFSFAIENNNTNAVHTTTTDDNIVDTYLPEGKIESDGTEAEGVLNLGTGIPATYIYVPTRDLTINLSFPNTVENKAVAYQQMKVTISGGDLENAIVIDLGNDAEMPVIATSVKPNAEVYVTDDSVYQIVLANALTYNIAYNVEVSGAGYRTARYTVTMQSEDIDGKVLNFWNNVKDNAVEVEEDKASSAKNVTFLAGDIVKDSMINIYDLSAVVSYFGEINLDTTQGRENYAKYDLNRDGKIDSKDVAYVLVSWGY